MLDPPVLPFQAQFLLPLSHQPPRLRAQAVGVSGKHEGVAVRTGAVQILQTAGVLQREGVVVRIDDPVVIVCKSESRRGPEA